ncbi:MAG TPA: hypothetical protein VE912_07980 [Bacteroidales bacterium]|nr:hypothetical protein [Bacteroidales bacterium]
MSSEITLTKRNKIVLLWKSGMMILLFILAFGINTGAQSIVITGIAINSEDSTLVEAAHVYTKPGDRATITDESGMFTLRVGLQDTLHVKALGYYDAVIYPVRQQLAAGDFLPVHLKPRTYAIREVTILPYRSYAQFKAAFKNHPISDENVPVPLDMPEIAAGPGMQNSGFGITFSPISMLYNQFSKEGKELRKYALVVEQQRINDQVAKKYNVKIVKRVTGIESEKDAYDFMDYCNLSDSFILKSNDYEILLAIKECFKAYQQEKGEG